MIPLHLYETVLHIEILTLMSLNIVLKLHVHDCTNICMHSQIFQVAIRFMESYQTWMEINNIKYYLGTFCKAMSNLQYYSYVQVCVFRHVGVNVLLQVTEYTHWSDCLGKCGLEAFKTRRREIITQPNKLGLQCPPPSQLTQVLSYI